MGRKKTVLSWSTGKDSAWALHVLRADPSVEVVGLVSVLNSRYDRVSMHSTRRRLLELQAEAADLPLEVILLPDPCSNEECDSIMARYVHTAAGRRIEQFAFGDIFLEDVRRYRERQLAGTGIAPVFPLWGRKTHELAHEMLDAGVKARISCLDPRRLPRSLAGRVWRRSLLAGLPGSCDPCGENGEFHTVVTDGPMFRRPIRVRVGRVVERSGFVFADIIPA